MAVVAVLVIIAIATTQFIAWVSGLINAARLDDRIRFLILLVTGVLSFGFIAMTSYLIAVA
jgi:hypothetical protein